MKSLFKLPTPSTAVAAGALLAAGLLHAPSVRAADPYDKALEARVEALERELNVMENDSKGKNVETTDVPTFARASANVQQLVLSGELRFRNEYGITDNQTNSTSTQSDANRFRFRLFADYKLDDQFFAGAAVQTALASDSGNTTDSEGFDNYSLYLWRFFVGWHSKDDNLRFIAGKQPNPFYEETEMLWDADISPLGLTEQVKLDVSSQLSFTLIGGQFIFNDNPENAFYDGNGTTTGPKVPGGDNNTDAYLAYQQILGTFKVSNDLAISAAGGYLFYPGHGGTGGAAATTTTAGGVTTISTGPLSPSSGTAGAGRGAGNGQGQAGNVLQNSAAFNSANSSRNLSIGTFNGDVKLGLGKLKLKVYGQAAYNFQGGQRDSQEYAQPLLHDDTTDKLAFSTGLTLGSDYQIKKKGDFVFLAEYRQVGLGSVDPNLNDSDWNFSRLGFRGFKVAGSYGFYPWLIATVTYYGATNLGEEKNLNIGVGNYNASQIIQFDLTTKF